MLRPGRLFLLGALGLAAGSCSFTTATGFRDCETDSQCSAEQVCLEHYCVSLPVGCRRLTGEFGSNNRVVFAAALPLSSAPDGGQLDQSEQQGLNALALAVEEGNLRDGIKGRKFALLFCNTGGDDALAKQQVEWLAVEMKVPAVVTSGSGQTIAIANVAAPKKMMVISATSTSPELIGTFQSSQQLVWRTAPSDSLQARVMADLIEADYPADAGTASTNIGIVYVNTTYGQGLSAGLRARLPARFAVKELPYELNDVTGPMVSTLASFAPRLTMVVGFPPDVRKLVDLARVEPGLSTASGHRWLFSDSAKDPAVLEGTGAELIGSLGTAPAQGAGATFPSFRDRFLSKHAPFDPSNFSFTSHSYDAMYLLMLSAAWASGSDGGVTGAAMAEGMGNVSAGASSLLEPSNFTRAITAMQARTPIDAEGASGKLNFDLDAGAPSSPYEVWRVEADGGLGIVRLVEPSGL